MNTQEIESLVYKWLEHCEREGEKSHNPTSNGGKATYQIMPSTGRIFCCVKGCTWKAHKIEAA